MRCCLILASSKTFSFYSRNKIKDFSRLNCGSKSAIEIISKFYFKAGIPVFIATDNDTSIFEFKAFKNCNLIELPLTDNPASSLSLALPYLDKYDEIILNPVSVIPDYVEIESRRIFLGKDCCPKENWSAVAINDHCRKIPQFLFKNQLDSKGYLSYPFTGIISSFKRELTSALSLLSLAQQDDIAYLAYFLRQEYDYKFSYCRWLDLEHDELHSDAKLHSISSRSFHFVNYVKDEKAIIKNKNSPNAFCDDENYFSNIPDSLKRFFPFFLGVSSELDTSSMKLEYIPYPTLSELYLHEDLGIYRWTEIIKSLHYVFDMMYLNTKEKLLVSGETLYANKLSYRKGILSEFIEKTEPENPLSGIFYKSFNVNGVEFPPLKDSFKTLSLLLASYSEKIPVAFGHGDLCFNNILVDPFFNSIKLIDPRCTSFGGNNIGYMHSMYDLAKLNHSFTSLYDSVVNNLFSLSGFGENKFKLHIHKPANYYRICEAFRDAFICDDRQWEEVQIITSSLFLSMLPLHIEDLDRVLALAIIGSTILANKKSLLIELF